MYAKQFLNQIGETKSKDTTTIITETTKGTIVGAAIGGGMGLLIAFTRKKNITFSIFIGSVIGGTISRFLLTTKN